MNEYEEIDPERAALITQRIGQTFNFARDVLDDPRMLEVIPDGSRLTFRDVELPGRQVRLVAYPVPGQEQRWAARLTGSSQTGAETGHALVIPASIESDVSAEAALASLAELVETIAELVSAGVQQPA